MASDGTLLAGCEDFGPVVLFRSMFLKSWNGTLAKIRELRRG